MSFATDTTDMINITQLQLILRTHLTVCSHIHTFTGSQTVTQNKGT